MREVAEAAARLYDEVLAEVHAEPVGSLARRLHTALGDLAHEALGGTETSALTDDERAAWRP